MAPEQGRLRLPSEGSEMTSWIYGLSKAQLTEQLEAVHVAPVGTVDDLRRLLKDFIRRNPNVIAWPSTSAHGPAIQITDDHEDAPVDAKLRRAGSTEELPPEEDIADYASAYEPAFAPPRPRPPEPGHIMDRVRKWGCVFDGRDAFAFLERVSDLREGYGVTGPQLLRCLPELLRGDPLLWYRNHRHTWSTWTAFEQAFRRRFLPLNVQKQLRREALDRQQRDGETFNRFVDSICTTMRRAGNFTESEQLELILDNMDPELRIHVRAEDTDDLDTLTERVNELELLNERRKAVKKAPITTRTAAATVPYDRDNCCWRCKQRGHTRVDCRKPAKKFCSQCGKDGVFTRDCHPWSGNASRTAEAATPRSDE